MNLKILFEDDGLIAVEKQTGELVVKDRFGKESIDNILIYRTSSYLKEQGHSEEDSDGRDLFPLHRLDRETSGIVLFAKNKESHRIYSKMFESGQMAKIYWLFVAKRPDWDRADIKLPLKRAEGKSGRGRALVNIRLGNFSHTEFNVKETFDELTWIEAIPYTGKLHQIRIHANVLGCPLLNDSYYGNGNEFKSILRIPLHARFVEFVHPSSGEQIKISCGLPDDMHKLLNELKKQKRLLSNED